MVWEGGGRPGMPVGLGREGCALNGSGEGEEMAMWLATWARSTRRAMHNVILQSCHPLLMDFQL